MSAADSNPRSNAQKVRPMRYSIGQILMEIEEDREGFVSGREMVEQDEISKLFKRRVQKRVRE